MKTEPDPGKMQSVDEHQEIPEEDAAVMPVGGLKKRRRDWNLAAGRRQKPKGRIQANCESRRRLTVAGKKMTHHATVAWSKRNVFRRIGTQGNCGPRSKLTAAGLKMTHHATVAWPREKFVRKDCTINQTEQETSKRRNDEKRRQQLRPRIEKMLYEIFRGRIAKQVVRTPNGLQKIRKWTLWRGQPPPKRKKR
jgi:hypothetical protein